MVLTVVLAVFGCGRKELNAVGFKLFLSGTAILRVFLQESGDVLFVLGILGIREVSMKAFGRIGYTVFTLPLCAALKCHDAAVDNGCTTVVFAFFKDDGCQQRRWRHTCRQCRSQLQQRLLSYPIWMACAEDRASERQKRERQSLQVRMRLRWLKTNGRKFHDDLFQRPTRRESAETVDSPGSFSGRIPRYVDRSQKKSGFGSERQRKSFRFSS